MEMESLGTFFWALFGNVWLSVAAAVLALIYWYGTRNHNYWSKLGINGPKPMPFLGNTFSLTTPIPTLYHNYMKSYGKFFGCFQGQKPMLFIGDANVIKRILVQDFNNFRNRVTQAARNKVMQHNLLIARDERWKRIRSIVSPTFTSSKMKKMEHLMLECCHSLIDALDQISMTSGQFVAHDLMGNFTMDVIAKCAFATDTDSNRDRENSFVKNAKAVFEFSWSRTLAFLTLPPLVMRKMVELKVPYIYNPGSAFFMNISRHLMAERRKDKSLDKEDMLQLMMNAEHQEENQKEKEEEEEQDDQFDAHHVNQGKEELEHEKRLLENISGEKSLSEDEILAQLMLFFFAGYETTASTMSYCLYALATTPEVQDKLHREIVEAKLKDPLLGFQTVTKLPYLDAVLSETLRRYPPAMFLNREAKQDYHIPECDYTVRKGDGITVPITAIHWSEHYYQHPERFDPERFMPENAHNVVPYSYLPFGGGPRNCIGMRFALAEAKLALAQLIDRYQFHQVASTPKKLTPLLSLIVLRTNDIHVGISKR